MHFRLHFRLHLCSRFRWRFAVAAGLAILSLLGSAQAQTSSSAAWPTRPVTIVVPFTAGATSDLVARALAAHLSAALGQPFIVDNRGGAGGNIGSAAVVRATPDGYTLLLATTGPAANNKLLYKDMPYDPQRDLAPIALIGKSPVLITAGMNVPAKNIKELVDYAKANPGKVTAGYPGNGTLGHIAGELLQQRAGIKFVQVQYRGSPPIIDDLLGGTIDVGMDSMAPYVPFVQQNKLRGLGIASERRWPQLPDVPTIAETGFPGYEASVWYAFVAPAATPPELIAKLNKAANDYLKTSAAAALFQNLGIEASGGTPEQLRTFVDGELAKWGPIIKSANIVF
jgi:tripartite-type tricarboxylate transporter receptor subunit TctC